MFVDRCARDIPLSLCLSLHSQLAKTDISQLLARFRLARAREIDTCIARTRFSRRTRANDVSRTHAVRCRARVAAGESGRMLAIGSFCRKRNSESMNRSTKRNSQSAGKHDQCREVENRTTRADLEPNQTNWRQSREKSQHKIVLRRQERERGEITQRLGDYEHRNNRSHCEQARKRVEWKEISPGTDDRTNLPIETSIAGEFAAVVDEGSRTSAIAGLFCAKQQQQRRKRNEQYINFAVSNT